MQVLEINHQTRLCEATYDTIDSPRLCYDPSMRILVYKSPEELDENPPIYFNCELLRNVSIEEFHQIENPRVIYWLTSNLIEENRLDLITHIVGLVGSLFFEYCPEYEPTLLMQAMDSSNECNKYAPFNCLFKLGAKVNCAAKIPIRHIVGDDHPKFAKYDSCYPPSVALCTPLWIAVNVKYAEKDQMYMAVGLLRKGAVCSPENTSDGEKVLQQAKRLSITANELFFFLGLIFDNKSLLFILDKDIVRLVLKNSLDLQPNTQESLITHN